MAWQVIEDYEGEAPKVGCVYAIYIEGELKYIGSTHDLHARLKSHFRLYYSNVYQTPWGPIMHATVKFKTSKHHGDWASLELKLIRRLKPPFNKKGLGRRNA